MNADPKAKPWMPRIQHFPKLGSVGVLKPRCTMSIDPLRLRRQDTRRGLCYADKRGEIGGVIEPRIHLSKAAILFRKTGPPLSKFLDSYETIRRILPTFYRMTDATNARLRQSRAFRTSQDLIVSALSPWQLCHGVVSLRPRDLTDQGISSAAAALVSRRRADHR